MAARSQASAKARSPRSAVRRDALPAVDERLVMPETRYEVIDGKVVYVPPADYSHGFRHSKVNALLEASAATGYEVLCDVLTRTSKTGDMAPDASVLRAGKDPRTGGRHLEELAFEVVSTQSLSEAGTKAAALVARGVRRVFAIDVKRKRALEWSRETGTWEMLAPDGVIQDKALALPLPIDALVGAASADDAMANALIAKNNRVIVAALEQREAKGRADGEAKGRIDGEAKGRAEGRLVAQRALLVMLAARGLRVSKATRQRVLSCADLSELERWLRRAATANDPNDVFGPPKTTQRHKK